MNTISLVLCIPVFLFVNVFSETLVPDKGRKWNFKEKLIVSGNHAAAVSMNDGAFCMCSCYKEAEKP